MGAGSWDMGAGTRNRISGGGVAPSGQAPSPSKAGPSTNRGRNTRAKILVAARKVFERDGFLDAKITDIAKEAGVANGSLYTYFSGKDEILAEVLEIAREEMLHPETEPEGPSATPVERIEHATSAYLAAYRRNAGLLRVFEQVATIDRRFHDMRLERAAAFFERNAKGIERLQQQGYADPRLDPMLASIGLSSMVSRVAYIVLSLGYPVGDFDELAKTLSRLWANALGIDGHDT